MNQLLVSDEDRDSLPPFRSSTEFPVRPRAEQLQALYPDCLQALRESNEARGILRKRMNARKEIIAQMRLEIERVERDFALEASTRMRLHSMNEKLLKALKEMDGIVDESTRIAYEGQRTARTGLRHFIEQLKNLVRRWRAFKLQLQQELSAGGEGAAREDSNE